MRKKESKKRQIRWDKLDNTALIFPVIAGEGMTNTYRISVELYEDIQPELLQKALDIVLPKFNLFNVRLRMGVFWYYFEENNKPAPRVNDEELFPKRRRRKAGENAFLFFVCLQNIYPLSVGLCKGELFPKCNNSLCIIRHFYKDFSLLPQIFPFAQITCYPFVTFVRFSLYFAFC